MTKPINDQIYQQAYVKAQRQNWEQVSREIDWQAGRQITAAVDESISGWISGPVQYQLQEQFG